MEYVDDRTDEQKKTHTLMVGGTDSFMSGWGGAEGGKSYAFWACKPEDERKVTEWMNARREIRRVRVVTDPYRPRGCVHCHIYVVDDGHPAINDGRRIRTA